MGRPIPRPRSNPRRGISTTQPQDRGGRREHMERRAAMPVLSLEQIDLSPLSLSLSITKRWQQTTLINRAFGAKQYKCDSSYHYSTHTRVLRLKNYSTHTRGLRLKNYSTMLGGSALRPTLGGSALRPTLWGSILRPMLGGSALRPMLGGFALRPTLEGSTLRPTLGGSAF
jgi:hypothetical protein